MFINDKFNFFNISHNIPQGGIFRQAFFGVACKNSRCCLRSDFRRALDHKFYANPGKRLKSRESIELALARVCHSSNDGRD